MNVKSVNEERYGVQAYGFKSSHQYDPMYKKKQAIIDRCIQELKELEPEKRMKIHQPIDVVTILSDTMHSEQEKFSVITMDGSNHVIAVYTATEGLLDKTQVHPREVFKHAIKDNAAKMIVSHNHPSGDLQPSQADLALQQRLNKASEIIGIPIIDHVIVGAGTIDYFSFRDEGLM